MAAGSWAALGLLHRTEDRAGLGERFAFDPSDFFSLKERLGVESSFFSSDLGNSVASC